MPEIEIRDNPKLKGFLRKITETGFTGVMWGLWAYMLLPLINILLWVMGFKYFHVAVIAQSDYMEFFALMERMGWIVLVVFLVLRTWGYYNYMVFGKNGKRRGSEPVTIEQLSAFYDIPADQIENMQSQKEVNWDGLVVINQEKPMYQ